MATTGTGYPKSVLAAESPPFNPQSYHRTGSWTSGGSTNGGTAYTMGIANSPNVGGTRSRSTSPYPSRGTSAAPDSNSNSNAVSKYTFQYNGETLEIRNVWAENVEEEMAVVRSVVEKYP